MHKLINIGNFQIVKQMLEINVGNWLWLGGYAEYVGKNYDVNLDYITISKNNLIC